jgi:hypothetical protein
VERGRDQVAGSLPRQYVLGGEEPVVAAQVHSAADGDRFADEGGPDLACRGCWDGVGEENPDVCADPGAGHLEGGGCADGSCGLEVGKRIEHGGLSVEVGGEPAGLVTGEHRIETDVDAAAQMRGEHLGCQRQMPHIGGRPSLAPPALDSRHPPGLARAAVLPTKGIDVAASAEERGIERELRLCG